VCATRTRWRHRPPVRNACVTACGFTPRSHRFQQFSRQEAELNGIKVISLPGRQDSISQAAMIRREVHETMDAGAYRLESVDGRTLAAGVEWCEARSLPYTIQAVPGALYVLHVDAVSPEQEAGQ
jgi:hypothetical protein